MSKLSSFLHRKRNPGAAFLCRDSSFYKQFFRMFLILMLQNIITYSVNVVDNIMLGAYSQTSLSAAAAINQLQFILQLVIVAGLGEGIVIVAGQYFGNQEHEKQQKIYGIGLCGGWIIGIGLTVWSLIAPQSMVALFTNDPAIIAEGVEYLIIVRWAYLIFNTSMLLLASLRSMKVVKIAFQVSCAVLVVNVVINYLLIFGKLGLPELGIRGAAIGTLISRIVELLLIIFYIARSRKVPVNLRIKTMFRGWKGLCGQYVRTTFPCAVSELLFSMAVSTQTMAFGHLSSDALAACSAAGTLFQYVKMIPTSEASAACVWISHEVGAGRLDKLKGVVHSLQVIFILIGLLSAILLAVICGPILSLYTMTDQAHEYAMQMCVVFFFTTIVMSYQMPCQLGIIRGGGDTRYTMISDLVYCCGIVAPLGLLSAFVFRWPVWAVTVAFNIDQLLKCFSVGYKVQQYSWIRKIT